MFDYWITLPETPAFESNIQLMVDRIAEEGEAPTIKTRDNVNHFSNAHGTAAASGKILLNFRLSFGLDETELLDYLKNGMSNPKPPVSVESIRSAYKLSVPPDDPDDPDEIPKPPAYMVLYQANKAIFLPFMNGNPSINDPIFLSGYAATEPLEL